MSQCFNWFEWFRFRKKVDKLDVGKLETFPKDLKKLSDVMDKEVVEKAVYNTLKTGTNCKIGTTINVGMSLKSKKRSCVKIYYNWNPSACSCENGRSAESIIDDSMIIVWWNYKCCR